MKRKSVLILLVLCMISLSSAQVEMNEDNVSQLQWLNPDGQELNMGANIEMRQNNLKNIGFLSVSEPLSTGNISDSAITNEKISRMDWTKLQNYPSSCSGNDFIRSLGDSISCVDMGNFTANTSGSANQLAFFKNSENITSESSLYWNSSENRLGINVSQPSHSLEVNGSASIHESLKMQNNSINNISSLSVATALEDGNISDSITISSSGTVNTGSLSGTVSNNIDTSFLTVSQKLTDGNISENITLNATGIIDKVNDSQLENSITVSSSGSVSSSSLSGSITNDVETGFLTTSTPLSPGNISDGAQSGLDADQLDGKNTSELSWTELGVAQSDVSKTDVGLENLQNINQSDLNGSALTWEPDAETLNVSVDESTLTISSNNLQVDSGGITSNEVESNTLTSSEIASGAIKGSGNELAKGAVNSTAITDNNISNTDIFNSSLTVTSGTGLSGGGSVNLGESTTISVNVDDSSLKTSSDEILVADQGVGNSKINVSSVNNTQIQNSVINGTQIKKLSATGGEVLEWNSNSEKWAPAVDDNFNTTNVSDDGTEIVSNVRDIDFASNLSVADDGDGTVTLNVDDNFVLNSGDTVDGNISLDASLNVNSGGNTDLFLSEKQMNRESSNSETFNISNTGSGSIELREDGSPVVTEDDFSAASDLDSGGNLVTGAITESGQKLSKAAVNGTAMKNKSLTSSDLAANAVNDSKVKDSITISGGSVDSGDLTREGTVAFNFTDVELANDLTLNSSASVDSSAVDSGLTDSQVNDALTISSSGQITLPSSDSPTTEGRIEWDTNNDRIKIGDGASTKTFYSGSHTTDTRADAQSSGGTEEVDNATAFRFIASNDASVNIDNPSGSVARVDYDLTDTNASTGCSDNQVLTGSGCDSYYNSNDDGDSDDMNELLEVQADSTTVDTDTSILNFKDSDFSSNNPTTGTSEIDIASNAIDSGEIDTAAVTNTKISNSAINGSQIGVSATENEVLEYNGSAWEAANDNNTQLDDEKATSNVNMSSNNITDTKGVQMNQGDNVVDGDSCSNSEEGKIVYNGTHHLGCQNGNQWRSFY